MICVLSILLRGQEVDTIQGPDINITSTHSTQGDYIKTIKGKTNESIIDLLDSQSAFFLKSNGPGSSVTTSLLGGSASHTSLTLNGIPVTNPLIGQLDFSLLPKFFNQGMTLNTGLSPQLSETGSIAGNIEINTYRGERPRLTVGTSVKDYGSVESFLSYQHQSKKATYSANISRLDAQNAFRYRIQELNEIRKQQHAENTATNLYFFGKWILNKNQELSADYWWQDQTRNIPPTLVQNVSLQSQDDRLTRLGLSHTYFDSQKSLKSRVGYTQQSIDYEDAQINYQNTGDFKTIYVESIAKLNQGRTNQFVLGYQGDYNQANNGGFESDQDLSTHKLLLGSSYQNTNWKNKGKTDLLLRLVSLQLLERSSQAISGNISHQVTLKTGAQLKVSLRKLWRAPAMNDLFWARGGNPNLLPEQGWEGNIGYLIRKNKALTFTGHLFSRWVDNYILWAPPELGQPFMASNVSRVWARGIDIETNWTIQREQYHFSLLSRQSLIYSSPDRDNSSIGLVKNEQLIYIPVAKSNLTIRQKYHHTHLIIDLQHTRGYKGINADLEPYTLVNASVAQNIFIQSKRSEIEHRMSIELRGVNLFNQVYSVIERRPMPGIYGEINFTYICPKLTQY